MEIALGLMTLFLDSVLLVSLVRNYKRLQQAFLGLGALALSIEMLRQVASFGGLYFGDVKLFWYLTSLLRMLVALGLMQVAFDLVGRKLPVKFSIGALLMYLIYAAFLATFGSYEIYRWIILILPITCVNLVSAVLLLRSSEADRLGFKWFAGFLVAISALQLGMPISFNTPTLGLLEYFEAIAVMLITVTLIVMCYEDVYQNLQEENARLIDTELQRVDLESKFQQAQKQESLGVMAAGIAHDFNNLLTSILGYASLAVTKLNVNDPVREDVYMIMSGARQAVELTTQMLTYAGDKPGAAELLDISDVVDGFSELSQSRMPGKVELVFHLQRNLPLLSGDGVQLRQVLMILLSNAATAMGQEKGQIEVATGSMDVSPEFLKECLFAEQAAVAKHVYLRVSDTGIGIDKEQLGRIFDPFYSGKPVGKGLGLASLSGIVRQHRGFVHVDSKVGKGSQFSVFFPIVSHQRKEPPFDDHARQPATPGLAARILVAETDDRIRGLIQTVMEKEGHEVVVAASGEETYDLLQNEVFDLLILDFSMPKVSGPEVYRDVRTRFPTLAVIFSSGYGQAQVAAEMKDDPYASFLSKPFTISDLSGEVNSMLPETKS